MTKEERVNKLIDRIEADLRKLGVLTGKNHISAFVVDDYYNCRAINDISENDIAIDISKIGGKVI